MKKIPTLFERDPETNRRYVTRTVHPGCEWVLAGEGTPTMKWDGTAVLVDDDVWKRREVKAGKPPPDGFRHEQTDDITGNAVGWVRARLDDPEDRWLAEAVDAWHEDMSTIPAGTYELVGPKAQGNPHKFSSHHLVRHGEKHLVGVPHTYEELAEWMANAKRLDPGFEGVVWHHPDGRMAKLKAKDMREVQS